MAYVMFLHGPGFDRKSWLANVQSSYIEDPLSVKTPLSPLCQQLVEIEDELGEDDLWLHPVQGVRGVTVRESGDGIDVSLPQGFGKVDFELAWDLMRMGVAHGATATDEEENSLDFSEKQISAITAQQSEFYWAALMGFVSQGSEYTLPVGGMLHLTVTPDDAASGAAALERLLVERMARYSDVFLPTIMQVRLDGVAQTLSNYGHIPSLIRSEIDLIMARGEQGDVIGQPVPASHFFSVIGERAENLGPWTYVPAIDFNAEPDLVAALRDVPPAFSIPKPSVASQEVLSGEDWANLAKSPCLVFLMVAAADGGVDEKEISAFGAILRQHKAVTSPIFSKILQIAQANFETFIAEFMQSGDQAKQQLKEFATLLASGKIPQDEAISIAHHLCGLGVAIASASGGFLGFGSKISKQEKEVLDFLEVVLVSCAKGETAVLSLLGLGKP